MIPLFELERTTPPQVWNKYNPATPSTAVYVGRGSPYGNPYRLGPDGTREEVIELFRAYLFARPALVARVREELRGRDLVCFCAPAACHGDVLLAVANG